MVILLSNWWTFLLRGLVAILFGLMAFILPGMALMTLIFAFGIYAILDGCFNIVAAFRRTPATQGEPWWALLIQGILSLIAGGLAFILPGLTAIALLYLIAGWALATGVMTIVAAIRLRKQVRGEWLMVLSGSLSILFGLMIAILPGPGALAVLFWIGAYSIAIGALLIALGFKIRSWVRHVSSDLPPGFPSVA